MQGGEEKQKAQNLNIRRMTNNEKQNSKQAIILHAGVSDALYAAARRDGLWSHKTKV